MCARGVGGGVGGGGGGERYVTVSLFCQNQIMRNQSHCILPCFFISWEVNIPKL